jgi:hypothetical protein
VKLIELSTTILLALIFSSDGAERSKEESQPSKSRPKILFANYRVENEETAEDT